MPSEIDRPRPVPSPTGFVVKNGLKIREQMLGRDARARCRDTRRTSCADRALGRDRDAPRPVPRVDSACSAFVMRLSTTCCSWNGSAQVIGRSGSSRSVDLDVRDAQRVAAQLERVVDDAVEIGDRALRLMLPREGQQVRNDLRGALRLLVDRVERARVVRRVGRRGEQQLRERHHARERIVQLVRDAAHQLADRRQLFLLHQLLGHPPLVGHVAHDAERAGDLAAFDERRERERAEARLAVDGGVAQLDAATQSDERFARSRVAAVCWSRGSSSDGNGAPINSLATFAARALERAIHAGHQAVGADREDRVRRRLDEPRVARLDRGDRSRARRSSSTAWRYRSAVARASSYSRAFETAAAT